MVGAVTPPAGRGMAVTPSAVSPRVLTLEETRNIMEGNDTTSPGPVDAAQPWAAANGQGSRVTFNLLDDPSRATLLHKR